MPAASHFVRSALTLGAPVAAALILASVSLTGCGASGEAPPASGTGGSAPTATGGGGAFTASGGQAPSASGGTLATSGGSSAGGTTTGGTANGGTTSASGGSGDTGGANTAGSGGDGGSDGSGDTGGANTAGSGGDGGSVTTAGSGGQLGTGKYPFPQNQRLERCTYPSNVDPQHAVKAFERWKREIVTTEGAGGFRRVKRPDSPGAEVNSTVSEGIAYGMLIAVMMGDQPLFDDLWKYSQLWLNENGLMHWYINAAGTQVLGSGGATDSDEDIAWALVMAARQWGGQGSLDDTYLNLAKLQIQRVWEHEVDHDRDGLLLSGDNWAEPIFNPSYFAPNQYRIFGQVTDNVDGWNRVIDTGYGVLEKCLKAENGNAENGLAPAWCNTDGDPTGTNGAWNYQYDSARVPFRIGQDYCYSGEPRARAYLAKVSNFFSGIGAANMTDGYALDGTPEPDPASDPDGPQSAVFVGSAAVGAMHDPKFQSFLDEAYGLVATGDLLARSTYYNLSWTTLSLLMLSGNLIEYSP